MRALARVSRTLERAGCELSLAHYRVLSAIAAGDERATHIAARLALGKPTISANVEALCKRGLLTRCGVESDQRAITLRITAEGRSVLDSVEAAMSDRLDALCARTPDPQRVRESLRWLDEALEAAHAQWHATHDTCRRTPGRADAR